MPRSTKGTLAAALIGMTLVSVAAAPEAPESRRIAVRVPVGFLAGSELERLSGRAKRRRIEIQTGSESTPVPRGWVGLHLSTLPVADPLRASLSRFPVSFEGAAFVFDGRAYSGMDDAIYLTDPARRGEAFAIGLSERALLALAARRLFGRDAQPLDYAVLSAELSKEGHFVAKDGRLAIDRAADRDRIGARDEFFQALKRETRGSAAWEFRETERAAAATWQRVAGRFLRNCCVRVRVFPDAATKALYTGSSRPADIASEKGRILVDIDATAPDEPDLVSPVLAAAGLAALAPAILERRTLLLAAGARRVGRWWGRQVRGFSAFTRAAGVEPSLDEVIQSAEGFSPVLAVGTAAAWLDAGARLEGEAALDRALGEADGGLRKKLSRWREASLRQSVAPPERRPLPGGFLRGVSYAMTNSIEEAYVSPRSLGALKHLRELAANSISVMPYGFSREARSEEIFFVHRSPQGETDEGTLRAVADAQSLGMTAMVKPQLWVGGGTFVGDIAMPDEGSWRSWFDSYRRFIVHHAVVAEASRADLFCVGTELRSTEERKNDWETVIAAVRLATGTPVLYASNWAANAPRVTFWDAVDAVGVDFYDPLARAEKVEDAALESGVRRAVRPVAELSRKLGKPVIFAEAGYPPVRGAWIAPHDEGSGRPQGGEDAARSIAAVYRALAKESWWMGVYWWKAFSDGKPAPEGERGFNFVGTPAEKAIREGFGAPLGVESRIPGVVSPASQPALDTRRPDW